MLASDIPSSFLPNAEKSQPMLRSPTRAPQDPDDATWGSNFWVTLVDPQVTSLQNSSSSSKAIQRPKLPFSPAPLQAKSAGIPPLALSCNMSSLFPAAFSAYHSSPDYHQVQMVNGGN